MVAPWPVAKPLASSGAADGFCTWVVVVAELFSVSGSGSSADTLTLLTTEPGVLGAATSMVSVVLPSDARLPRLQSTWPPACAHDGSDAAEGEAGR